MVFKIKSKLDKLEKKQTRKKEFQFIIISRTWKSQINFIKNFSVWIIPELL